MIPRSSTPPRKNYLPKSSRGVRKVNPKRRAKEWLRAFHSDERVEFINALPCAVARPWCGFATENHHVTSRGAGGTYLDIAPVCEWHHALIHHIGRKAFEARFEVDLAQTAVETQARWLEFSGESE